MARFQWKHIPDVHLGAYTNPYTVWFEVIGRRYTDVQPGQRPDLPEFWIADHAPPPDPSQPWGSSEAGDQLGALRIEDETPVEIDAKAAAKACTTSGGPSVWHRAPLRAESVPAAFETLAPCPEPGGSGDRQGKARTIVAIIDDATNFAHHRFRSGDGRSRVDYAWVMDGTATRDCNSASVPFGREWSNAQINEVLQEAADEADMLHRLELSDFAQAETIALSKRISHGTHIMDIAAGFAPEDTRGDNHRIISVQLPRRVILEASGAVLHLFFKAAIRYVEARARKIAQRAGDQSLPLVVNFSYGLGAGSHLGSHPIEKVLAEMTTNRDAADPVNPLHVVLPAGNRFRADGHASWLAHSSGEKTLDLDWMIPAEDPTPNFLEIWLPDDAVNPVIEIVPPGNTAGGSTQIDVDGGGFALAGQGSDIVAWVTADTESDAAGAGIGKTRVLVAVAPTRVARSDAPPAPAGVWHVKASATLAAGQDISAWIQRDDQLFGYRRPGRQSYFVDRQATPEQLLNHELEEFADPHVGQGKISGYGVLNAIGSLANTHVVAGYRWRDQSSAQYSSAGSSTVRAPTLSAVSDRSRVLAGVLAAGSRSGSRAALNGTSVAAPQLARALALALAEDSGERPQTPLPEGLDIETTDAPTPAERKRDALRGRKVLLRPQDRVENQLAQAFAADRLVR